MNSYAEGKILYISQRVLALQKSIELLEQGYLKSYKPEDTLDYIRQAKKLYSEALALQTDLADWIQASDPEHGSAAHMDTWLEVEYACNQMDLSLSNMEGTGGGTYSTAMERYLLNEDGKDEG